MVPVGYSLGQSGQAKDIYLLYIYILLQATQFLLITDALCLKVALSAAIGVSAVHKTQMGF